MKTFGWAVCCAGWTAGCVLAQAPVVQSVVNAGSNDSHLCPGVVATISGSFSGKPTVSVGGKAAYIFYSSPAQLGVQIPAELPAGTTTLTVAASGSTSSPVNLTLDAYAPALFNGFTDGAAKSYSTQNPAHPGDTVIVTATGLGPTNPSIPTGLVSPKAAATIQTTSITVGGKTAKVAFSGMPATQDISLVGTYQVVFTVPPDAQQGNNDVVLTIAGKSTRPVSLAVAFAALSVTSVVNGASFSTKDPLVPGSFASVFVAGLRSSDNLNLFPGTSFAGLSVTFNGIPAPLFHVVASKQQINLLVPSELPETGPVAIEVKTADTQRATLLVQMGDAAPGIFRVGSNAAAQIAGTAWIPMPASLASSLQLPQNCRATGVNPASACAQPAAAGDYVQLYVTGLGKATPNGDPNGATLATGQVAPSDGSIILKTMLTPQVSVGGLPVEVLFSGLTPGYAGLYQVNFRIPDGVGGGDAVPIVISMNGNTDVATIAIQSK